MTKKTKPKPPPIEPIPGEIWRPLEFIPGYDVSTHGRVRSHRRTNTLGYPLLMKPTITNGYERVCLPRPNTQPRKYKHYLVHRLVLKVFRRLPVNGEHGCHNDGNPLNNCIENLRWDTPSSNMQDKKKHGTNYGGSRHHNTNLTESDVVSIWHHLRETDMTQADIGALFGIEQATVSSILRGKSWTQLTKTLPRIESRERGRSRKP